MIAPMRHIFADTAGWGHLVDASQLCHAQAAEIYRIAKSLQRKLITTNYVIAELVALLLQPLRIPHPKIASFIDGIKSSPHVEIVHVDPETDRLAWQLFTNRPDKARTLVDCASLVVMENRGLSEALTTDHHFEQAGFVRLLKS